jgi:sterol desaturase/sphingolipid hydroxylase (fatty acid hydroxylase superfamily)
MDTWREQLFLLISTPVYAFVIGGEILLSNIFEKKFYSKKGTLYNLYLMLLNMGLDFIMLSVCLYVLTFFSAFGTGPISNPWIYWIVLLVFEDFMFYMLHYVDHYCRLFWAIHVTHHSSDEFNLTVGFRSSVFQPLYRFLYFIPIALCGFRPMDIVFMYSVTQVYGILIHTQFVGKLGFLEWFMATPSHHRVHHGSNPQYLDKNLGMIFIIWDRLFGTFEEENENVEIRYGLTKPLEIVNPGTIVFHEWSEIGKDIAKPLNWRQKIMYLFGPPGWSHDGSRKTSKQLLEEYRRQQEERPNPL